MKFYVAVTDTHWYEFLSLREYDNVNFWQPGGNTNFRILSPGEPFLFKLKRTDFIGGVGFFSSSALLPISFAWDLFGLKNGSESFEDFVSTITRLRSPYNTMAENPDIGCIVLTNPVFFQESDWISIPSNFSRNIVQGKSYNTDESFGEKLWDDVQKVLHNYDFYQHSEGTKSQLILEPSAAGQYGKSILTKVRLGQDAFRLMVTDAYFRKCAITGEKTLPVLESAHIKPYSKSGPHFISNALLLRSDLHKLLDRGYITITEEYRVEVSRRIKQEYENGKEYLKLHGLKLSTLPIRESDKPSKEFILWHNTKIFK
jgi:putative restriction endonuclease